MQRLFYCRFLPLVVTPRAFQVLPPPCYLPAKKGWLYDTKSQKNPFIH